MIRRISRCFRAETTKLWRQRLPWVGLILVVLLTGLAVWLNAGVVSELEGPTNVPRNAFRFFAVGLRYGVAMGVFFLVLVAGLSMAAESGQGTLKMVLVRPVHRSDVFLAKVLSIFAYALAMLALAALTAGLVAGACPGSDYGPVIDPQYDDPANPYIFTQAPEMWAYLASAVAALILPLLAAGALGLTVSVLFENPGVASGTSVVSLLGLEIVTVFLDRRDACLYVFNHYLPTLQDRSYVTILRQNAEGVSDAFWPPSMWTWNLVVPAVTMVVLLVLSLVVFQRKAILS
jgi:ABC-2 type transport system permease protein